MFKVLDLFSGIGGFSLGLESTGLFETEAFCEIDEDCRKVLRKHWPTTKIYTDIRELKGAEIGSIDVVTGGFPCQPFSSINTRGKRGADHDGFLWPEMQRVIAETNPTWVIGENVARIAAMELDRIQFDLEKLGYNCIPITIPACAVGSPQIRERVWFVAHTESQREPRTMATGESSAGTHEAGRGYEDRRPVRLDPTSTDRGWSERRPHYTGVRRVAPGLPSRMDKARLKQLGNAVNPLIPYEIGRAIGFAATAL